MSQVDQCPVSQEQASGNSSVPSVTLGTSSNVPSGPVSSVPRASISIPSVPGKKCVRSVSQISRLSVGSSSSSPSHHSDQKYSYDQVSLSGNFNKPVILSEGLQPSSPKVDDIFGPSAVTFGSPLADVSGGNLQFAQRRTNDNTHEAVDGIESLDSMTALDSKGFEDARKDFVRGFQHAR